MRKMTFPAIALVLAITSCGRQAVREKSIRFQGNDVRYETRGEGSRTLFFIHGWTGSRESWKHQLDAFPDRRVIAVDLPGNGKSGKNENTAYTMDLFADAIRAILRKENADQAVFIGHSMGFAVAEAVSVKYPEVCRALCSIDGAHFVWPEDPAEQEAWIQYNRAFAETMSGEQGRNDFINALFLADTPQMLKDEVFRVSRAVPLSVGKSMIEGVETGRKYWEKRVKRIPCLAVYSPAYRLTEKDKADFVGMYPLCEYHEIGGVSHFFMLEIPYKVNQIISDFLAKNGL